MNSEIASDEVTDAIAHIEMHRQEAVKEVGVGSACAEALRKLHALLEQERATPQTTDPKGNAINLEAINQEIRKVKGLAGNSSHHDNPRPPRKDRPAAPNRGTPQGQPRNKGRRTMGRTSGR